MLTDFTVKKGFQCWLPIHLYLENNTNISGGKNSSIHKFGSKYGWKYFQFFLNGNAKKQINYIEGLLD